MVTKIQSIKPIPATAIYRHPVLYIAIACIHHRLIIATSQHLALHVFRINLGHHSYYVVTPSYKLTNHMTRKYLLVNVGYTVIK